MRVSWALLLAVPFGAGCSGSEKDDPVELPQPLHAESPFEFPVSLWDEGIEGETRVMVHVTALGEVDSAYVKESSGYAEFDSAAVAGATRLRFTPGRRGQRRVDHWVVLPVRFSKDGTAVTEMAEQGR